MRRDWKLKRADCERGEWSQWIILAARTMARCARPRGSVPEHLRVRQQGSAASYRDQIATARLPHRVLTSAFPDGEFKQGGHLRR